VVAGALVVVFAAGIYAVVSHRRFKHALLISAGEMEPFSSVTRVPVEVAAGAAPGRENAASLYLQAINHWNARRTPRKLDPKASPVVFEPVPDIYERMYFLAGSMQRSCDFYDNDLEGLPLAYYISRGKEEWQFSRAYDPYAMRPYVGAMRLFAQGILTAAKRAEQRHGFAEAEAGYKSVVRFGWHIRQNPGSILDVQLGLELEQKALHYLDVLYKTTRKAAKRQAVWKYGDSLNALAASTERKYTQLGNPEVAMRILERDPERIWRVQAAAALALAADQGRYGWMERRDMLSALDAAQRDADPLVQRAALTVLTEARKVAASTKIEEGAAR
jgi:hypothetical protein